MAKSGPKFKEIDLEEFRKLAALQCTHDEAAAWFGVSKDTIKRRLRTEEYRDAWDAGTGMGRASLRRTQFRMAETNAAMAIFLGKNYLGQSDKQTTEIIGADGKPIAVRWADEGDDDGE